jgi:hypothetical protein
MNLQPSRQVPRAGPVTRLPLTSGDRREAKPIIRVAIKGLELDWLAHAPLAGPVLTEESRYADEVEKASRRGLEVGGEFGNLVTETIQLGGSLRGDGNVR